LSVEHQVQFAKSLGHPGRDVRHVGVYVEPKIVEEGGQLVQRHGAYVGEANGDFSVDFPTDFIFMSVTKDWVFESFELGGKTWDGIAFLPADGDFKVSFGDANKSSVIVEDECKCFFTFRYQMVLRNTVTGERVIVDPGVDNKDRPPTNGGGG